MSRPPIETGTTTPTAGKEPNGHVDGASRRIRLKEFKLTAREAAERLARQNMLKELATAFREGPERASLISSLNQDLKARGQDRIVGLTDFGTQESTAVDSLINRDTAESRYNALLLAGSDVVPNEGRETHLGIDYSVKEYKFERGVVRKDFTLVEPEAVAAGELTLLTEYSFQEVLQGQDANLIVRTYDNRKKGDERMLVDVVTFGRAQHKNIYVGKIPWAEGYKQHVAGVFKLLSPR